MTSNFPQRKCPILLLSEQAGFFPPGQLCRKKLDALLHEYSATHHSQNRSCRDRIFFRLSPMLMKLLRKYCGIPPNCRNTCIIGDLLSDAYIAFTRYLSEFDKTRNVEFLTYIIKRLRWCIYNNFAREQRIKAREILWDENCAGSLGERILSISFERQLFNALELESCLEGLATETRTSILYRFFGHSYTEISEFTNKREAAIRKAHSRAYERFRKTNPRLI